MITTWSTSGLSDTALTAFAFIPFSLGMAFRSPGSLPISYNDLLILKNSGERKGGVSPCQAKTVEKGATGAVVTISTRYMATRVLSTGTRVGPFSLAHLF